jgi:hypothetical protein
VSVEQLAAPVEPLAPLAPLVPVDPPAPTDGLSFAHAARTSPKAATAITNLRIIEPLGSTLNERRVTARGRA